MEMKYEYKNNPFCKPLYGQTYAKTSMIEEAEAGFEVRWS